MQPLSLPALVLLVIASLACTRDAPETHGFVATLGHDTTSVERITRTGNRVVGDAVGRSPVVVRRQWEATLAPDGTMDRWTMDTYIPNAPPGRTELHHAVDFSRGAIRITRRGSGKDTSVTYRRDYAVTMPWNAYVYGTYELLFDAARTRNDTARIGQYFFEGWDEGNIGWAKVRAIGDGSYGIRSTGLAGEGMGRLDTNGHLLSYSGIGTTYKQEVRRVADVPDLAALLERFAADERAMGVPRSLSERDTARSTFDGATFVVDYSRPLARGRVLAGALIPYGRVWRTGANAATQLSVSRPIRIGDIPLDSGTYTLWTLPTDRGVTLIVNAQTGQWGTGYNAQRDVGRTSMTVDTAAPAVEQFTIAVAPRATTGRDIAHLVMEWGNLRWSVPIIVRGSTP